MISLTHDEQEYRIGINCEQNVNIPIYSNMPKSGQFVDEVIIALAEFAISYITLGRLGIPRSKHVHVELDGPFPRSSKKSLEYLLQNVMNTRSLVAGHEGYGCVNVTIKSFLPNKIQCNFDSNRIILPFSGGMDSTAILKSILKVGYTVFPLFIEYDEGNDSFVKRERNTVNNLLAHFKIKANGGLKHILTPLKNQSTLPWNTDPYGRSFSNRDNVQNTDRWEIWGRNLALTTAIIAHAIKYRAKYIYLGHTKEGMFSLHKDSKNKIFYDRCCVSLHTINVLNNILEQIFEDPPVIICPLRDMNKGSVGRYLLGEPGLFSITRSCIDLKKIECGVCFSCLDKYTSIVANSLNSELDIKASRGNYYEIWFDGKIISLFKWLATKRDGGLWSQQLLTYLQSKGEMPINLQHSIYCPDRMIAALYVLEQKGLKEFLPEEYFQVKKFMGCEVIENFYFQYTEPKKPLSPIEFIQTSQKSIRKTLILANI